jgi:tRNA(Ile)-lysidine synthase
MGWDLLTLPRTGIRAGERVAVAVSGGADSTALLLLVAAANALPKNALGVGLTAVHVNHGLRGAESDGDQEFVRALCERLGVGLHVVRVPTAEYAAENKQTIEEAARNLRYQEFDELLAAGRADVVLTAHTLDDQAETVLMKLLRGAWLEGLGGISPVVTRPKGRVARPLLGVRRAALREYLGELGEAWREDSSNEDEAFTRNRIRRVILPMLREENPAIDGTLANLAELAREEEARWDLELKRVLPQLILPGKPVRGGGRASSTAVGEQAVALELERLRPLDAALRRRVVRAAARQLGARLSFEETARVLTLAGFAPGGVIDSTVPAKVGGRLRLAGGLVVERSARELRMSREG